MGGDRRRRGRVAGRPGGRNLVAGQQHWPRLLGYAGGDPAGVRRHAAVAAAGRQPCRGGRSRRQLAAHRRFGCASRRRAVRDGPDRGPGAHRWPQPLSAGHRGHRRRGVADGSAWLCDGVLGAGRGRPRSGPAGRGRRARCGHQPSGSAAGDRGHPRRRRAAARAGRRRRAAAARRRHPADHQRQAGPAGLPRPIPRRQPRRRAGGSTAPHRPGAGGILARWGC